MAIAIIVLLTLTLWVFWPSLFNGFVYWDDEQILFNNPALSPLDIQHCIRIFTTNVHGIYFPCVLLSFAIEHHYAGLNPFIYHLDNLLLHTGVVILIFSLCLRLKFSLRTSFFAGLLFALHPMHVESVAWITERKDVLYSVFYLLAIHQYLSYCQTLSSPRYLLALLFAFLSVLAKPMALSLPLILFLIDWLEKRKFNRKAIIEKIPFFLLIIPIAGITYFLNARIPFTDWGQAPLIWVWTFVFYLKKFLFPVVLLPLYALPGPVTIFNPAYFVAAGVFLAFMTGLLYWRNNRLWVFACGYYFFSIFFLLRFDTAMDITLVADRFMYLPSLGFCILIGFYVDRLLKITEINRAALNKIALVAIVLIFGALSVKTFLQCKLWGDEPALWENVIRIAPVPRAYNNLGRCYNRRGQFDLALKSYKKAVEEKRNDNFLTYNDMGIAATGQKDYDSAIKYHSRSLELNPYYPDAYINRGAIYDGLGKYDLAFNDYTKAIDCNPSFAQAYRNRSILYYRKGDLASALADLNKAIDIMANLTSAYYLRGQIYSMLGDNDRASADFDKVLTLNSRHAGAKDQKKLLFQGHKISRQSYVLDIPVDTYRNGPQ